MKKNIPYVKEILLTFLFFILFFISPHLQAQYTITYDVKTTSQVKCAKGEELLLDFNDRLQMRKIEEDDSYTIKVFENGERETTIIHRKSNKLIGSKIIAAKTRIDEHGVKVFDKDDKLITDLPHSTMALEAQKGLKERTLTEKLNFLPDFDKASEHEINEMVGDNAKIKNLGNGGIHARNGDKEVLYDQERKMVEIREFEGKDLKYSFFQKYQLDQTKRNVPIYSREINMVKNAKGNRFWQFKEQNYSNYKISSPNELYPKSELLASGNVNSSDKFSVYPNPASKQIFLNIPLKIFDQSPTVLIYDFLGKVINPHKAKYALETIDISIYPVGLYTLQVETEDGERLIQKFIKQ